MKKVTVAQNQNLQDLALQELGTADAAFDLAVYNEVSPSALLFVGQEFEVPDSLKEKYKNYKDTVDYYLNHSKIPYRVITGSYEQSPVFVGDYDNRDYNKIDYNS